MLDIGFDKLFKSNIEYAKKIYTFSSIGSIINSFSQIIIIFIGGIAIVNGNLTVGKFTVISSYFNIFIGSIKYFLELSKSYQDVIASIVRLEEIENIPKIKSGNITIKSIERIEFKNVDFSYGDQKIISNLSLIIKKPGVYNVIGENGSGKSTFLNLLAGIIEPDKGDILINSINISELDKASFWENNIAFQQQNTIVLGNSLEEFIKLGLDKDEISRLQQYKENLNCIKNCKTESRNEKSISGGERQKINLARVFSKNNSTLILDEPTTFLDLKAKKYLENEINKIAKKKIVIVVSHNDTILFNEKENVIRI